MICDLCGDTIPQDKETKCEKCEIVRCACCVDACKECGDLICCNVGIFNHELCIECEKKYYLEVWKERLER